MIAERPHTLEPRPTRPMIKELTPFAVTSLVLLVVSLVSVLTLVLSALLLWRYRQAVTRQMAASGGFDQSEAEVDALAVHHGSDSGAHLHGRLTLYRQAVRGPWQIALRYVGAGLGFALVFAVVARFVYPYRLDLPGFLLGVWLYAWPVVLAVILIVPAAWRQRLAFVAAYFMSFLMLIFWAGTITDIPASQFGAINLPARSSATPTLLMKFWLVIDGVPTVLVLLCFNRWARPVAPLVLGFVTTAISGTMAAYLALYSKRGVDATVALAVSLHLHPGWLVLGTVLLSLAIFGAIGWALARWIARAYHHGKVNDQSLLLDALWLLFASYYTMWLILGGLVWTVTAPVAFVVYKVTSALARRLTARAPQATCSLTFLRVFSLGRRSERLLDTVARYWRHIGNVQMITGPDVARSTVQPHQFLDFLSGRLAMHFVHDAASLDRSVAQWDRAPGPDGRFHINNFFCDAVSWKHALPRLVQQDNVVLMDVRSFSATNAGCIHELRHLVSSVPLDRFLLIVDNTTDAAFLERILREAWQALPPNSANRNRSPEEVSLHRFGAGTSAVRKLVWRLCGAAVIASTG